MPPFLPANPAAPRATLAGEKGTRARPGGRGGPRRDGHLWRSGWDAWNRCVTIRYEGRLRARWFQIARS